MNTKIIKQAGMSVFALGVMFALSSCASKPSPWSQQDSPWENQQNAEQAEQAVSISDMVVQEQSPYENESSGIAEPIGPVGGAFEEPVMAEPVMEESMPMESEAVMEAEPEPMMAAVGGDINSQPPEYFAVQVVASSNMENLQAFASRHQFLEEWVAQTSVDGKTWFILLQGVYPTMEEAASALAQVSQSLDTSPWIRSVGSLQSVIVQ